MKTSFSVEGTQSVSALLEEGNETGVDAFFLFMVVERWRHVGDGRGDEL